MHKVTPALPSIVKQSDSMACVEGADWHSNNKLTSTRQSDDGEADGRLETRHVTLWIWEQGASR